MRHVVLQLAALCLLGAAAAPAAVVTITDCATDPHIQAFPGLSSTRIQLGADDLVLHCNLVPLSGTDKILITAHDVTIQGGGASAPAPSHAIDIQASGAFSAVSADIEATDRSGNLQISAATSMHFDNATLVVGDNVSGERLELDCTGTSPACAIDAVKSSFKSRRMSITAVGDVTFTQSKITSVGPSDKIEITSTAGNVKLGTGAPPAGGECCGMSGGGGNTVVSGVEGELFVSAFGLIDFTAANVLVAENISLTSGVGAGPASVPASIDLTDASLRNDFGKPGEITVLADEGVATITIAGATLIDDQPNGQPDDLSTLNGCSTTPRSGCPNVAGTAATDD